MINKYEVDKKLKKEIRREQRKKHPKWEQRKIVRIILNILLFAVVTCSVILTVVEINLYNQGVVEAYDAIMNAYIPIAMLILFIVLPIGLYYRALNDTCSEKMRYVLNESLVLNDDGIEYGFTFNDGSNAYIVNKIDYADIRKIVINTYHNRVDFYGNSKSIRYADYENDVIENTHLSKNDKERFYFYFNDMDKLISIVSEKSGAKVSEINKKCE